MRNRAASALDPMRNVLAFRRDPIAFFGKLAATGDAVPYRLGAQPMLLVNHPELARELLVAKQNSFAKGRVLERAKKRLLGNGLLTSEGAEHRRNRKLVQPAFHRDRIAGYARTMTEVAEKTAAGWRPGLELNLNEAMQRLALCIAGRTLFSVDLDDEAAEIGRAVREVLHRFSLIPTPWELLIEKLPIPTPLLLARRRLDALIFRMMRERRAVKRDFGDLLSMLLEAGEAEGSGFSDEQVRDEVMTLLIAGHETTALALAWAGYALAAEPKICARIAGEAEAAAPGRTLQWSDLEQMPYCASVFAEVLRLYPPAWAIGRRAVEDVELGGHPVTAGTVVVTCQYLLHRDPRFWSDPERFLPERWTLEERKRNRDAFTYFPFGAGARSCIGEQFAWTEGILVLATLFRKWRLEVANGGPVGLRPLVTLHPASPILVRPQLRQPPRAAA